MGVSSEPEVPMSQVWRREDLIPRVNLRSLGNRHQGQNKTLLIGLNFSQLPRGPRTVGTQRQELHVTHTPPPNLDPKVQETESWDYMWDLYFSP